MFFNPPVFISVFRNTNSIQSALSAVKQRAGIDRTVTTSLAAQVAERAGISLGTLHKIEKGDPTVSVAAFLEVLRSLGILDVMTESLNPLNSDLGRARINENLPRRIR